MSSINIWQENDTYEGNFKFPNKSATAPRPDFRGGWMSLVGPSIIYSPDPLVRFTATYLQRVKQPSLGPSPSYVVNLGASISF